MYRVVVKTSLTIEVAPSDLVGADGTPRRLQFLGAPAGEIARRYALELAGPDVRVTGFATLAALGSAGERPLTYLNGAEFAVALTTEAPVVITRASLRDLVPRGATVLLTDAAPRDLFCAILADAATEGGFERVRAYRSPSAQIDPAAIIGENVWVDDEAQIGPGAVVLPNTYVGPACVIKPNCTIGGNGFEAATIGGRRRIVAHAGGVWLSEAAQIGSSTCVDRGLYGDLTYVGPESLIDNLIHFAHSARCGRGCSLIASCEISGSVVLGDNVWVGPNAAINPGVTVGDNTYIGTGAVVTRNLPPHVLAYGSPAKVAATICVCRQKLDLIDGRTTCGRCGRSYRTVGEPPVLVAQDLEG